MDKNLIPRELRPFMDEYGRLKQWPTRQKVQRMAADYLATRLEAGREYTEREINELLCDWHTFADWALLRRVMFDWCYIDRESDGSRYRLRPRNPDRARDPGASPNAGASAGV